MSVKVLIQIWHIQSHSVLEIAFNDTHEACSTFCTLHVPWCISVIFLIQIRHALKITFNDTHKKNQFFLTLGIPRYIRVTVLIPNLTCSIILTIKDYVHRQLSRKWNFAPLGSMVHVHYSLNPNLAWTIKTSNTSRVQPGPWSKIVFWILSYHDSHRHVIHPGSKI